jgi:hypothetical protein
MSIVPIDIRAVAYLRGGDGGNPPLREFLDQYNFYISNGYFIKKQKL